MVAMLLLTIQVLNERIFYECHPARKRVNAYTINYKKRHFTVPIETELEWQANYIFLFSSDFIYYSAL